MYVVVAGGGHMGSHLASRLVSEGHDTVVIDVDRLVTDRIFTERGLAAIHGSATDMGVLEQAGIKRADVAVAMTGRDSDNLSFCLLARYFGVPRILARMLDPKYEMPYRLVGATKIHSAAEVLVNSFLTSIEYPPDQRAHAGRQGRHRRLRAAHPGRLSGRGPEDRRRRPAR
jgi:trk system potassium uptake protein TrkA